MFHKLSPALRLALLYFFISSAWILLSDFAVAGLAEYNPLLFKRIQSFKGLAFILFCSFILFFVARKLYRGIGIALQQSEETLRRYKALIEATKDGIVDHDLLTDTAVINEQMRFYMNEDQDIVQHFSLKHRKRIHPDDLSRLKKNFRDTLETRSNIWQADYRYLFPDGNYHDVINKGYIIRDQENKALRMISAIQDVSEIRNMRTAIYHQEIKHREMLGKAMIKGQEEERNRWAEELHDNVGQQLTVIKLYLDHLSSEVSSPMLVKTREMAIKALNDIRQLSASLKPPEFSSMSLRQSIDQLLSNILRIRKIRFELDICRLNEKELKDEQKLMIYRVVQEQLSNIIKYANATLVKIGVWTEDDLVTVEVNDNGNGFDPGALTNGIGLRNVRSRLQVFSGSLDIESAPGKGCRLTAQFHTA